MMIFPPVAYPVSSSCFIEFKQTVSPHPRQEACYGLEAQPGLHRKFQANLSYNGLLKNTKPTNKQKSRAFRAIKVVSRIVGSEGSGSDAVLLIAHTI